jgi:hypothetical protein
MKRWKKVDIKYRNGICEWRKAKKPASKLLTCWCIRLHFFIKKKDRKLRFVQDYCKLNAMTIKNWYPLPLSLELVEKLCSAKYFTKLNVRWGYQNIQIKEGDEWKAAFQCNQGLFELLVMLYGMTNSLAVRGTLEHGNPATNR